MSDGAQRLVVNCGGPGPLPTALSERAGRGAAHDRGAHAPWCSPTPIRPRSCPTARSARASRTSRSTAARTMTASRLEASHDGYVRGFGLVHKRSLMLGNDGKELRGADQLIAKGPQEDPRSRRLMRSASISRRASRRPSPPTAWARSSARTARRRGISAAAAAMLDDRGKPVDRRPRPAACRRLQLVVVGEVSRIGGEIGWQFRRSS